MRRCGLAMIASLAVFLVASAPSTAQRPPPKLNFTNPAPIYGPRPDGDIGTSGPAYLYPSVINVSGGTGIFSYLSVTLNGVNARSTNDLDVMLESPSGQRMMLMSDVGGRNPLANGTVTIGQGDRMPPTNALTSGTYNPANYVSPSCNTGLVDDFFESPAIPPPAFPTLLAFTRSQINGAWKLYVMDDCSGDTNNISGGWTIKMDSSPDSGVAVPARGTAGPASPYPLDIPVSDLSGTVSKVVATLKSPAHTHPDDLDILLQGPTGATTLLMSDAGGDNALDGLDSNLSFDDGAGPAPDTAGLFQESYRPTDFDSARDSDSFPAPAPPGPFGTALASFNGSDPNGTWRLFAVDDNGADVGGFAGASLKLTTTTPDGRSTTTTVSSKDTERPSAVLLPSGRPKLGSVLRRGYLRLRLRLDEAATYAGQGILAASTAKKLGLPANGKAFTSAKKRKARPAIIATGKGRARRAGSYTLKLKLTRKARKRLARRKSVKLAVRARVTDRAGNRTLAKRSVTLRR